MFMKTAIAEDIEVAIDENVKFRDDNGKTALMYAAKHNGNPEVLLTLIKSRKNNIGEKDNNGNTALMYAAKFNGNPEIVSTLINNGAKVNEPHNNGKTALMFAVENNNNRKIVSILIKNGAEVTKVDNRYNWTALVFAAQNNSNPEVIRTLLENGKFDKEQLNQAFSQMGANRYLNHTDVYNDINNMRNSEDNSPERRNFWDAFWSTIKGWQPLILWAMGGGGLLGVLRWLRKKYLKKEKHTGPIY